MASAHPSDLRSWIAAFEAEAVPVLATTVHRIEALREKSEDTSAHELAEVVTADPLMSIKVFRHLAHIRGDRQLADIDTITGSLVMLGVPPFFKAFPSLVAVESLLARDDCALHGLQGVIQRAITAHDYAREWAARRQDLACEIMAIAALLHDFAEMLLWCWAPSTAQQIQAKLAATPGLRSATAQWEVLGFELDALRAALMSRWQLPTLLRQVCDPARRDDPRERLVLLAVAMARHAAHGWDDPALPDDYAELGVLLHLSPSAARALVEPSPPRED